MTCSCRWDVALVVFIIHLSSSALTCMYYRQPLKIMAQVIFWTKMSFEVFLFFPKNLKKKIILRGLQYEVTVSSSVAYLSTINTQFCEGLPADCAHCVMKWAVTSGGSSWDAQSGSLLLPDTWSSQGTSNLICKSLQFLLMSLWASTANEAIGQKISCF